MKVNIIPTKYPSIKINSSLMYNLTSSKVVAEIITGIDKNKIAVLGLHARQFYGLVALVCPLIDSGSAAIDSDRGNGSRAISFGWSMVA